MKKRIIAWSKKIVTGALAAIAIFYLFVLIFHPEKQLLQYVTVHLRDQAGIHLDYTDVKLGFPDRIIIYNPSLQELKHDVTQPSADGPVLGEKTYFRGERFILSIDFLAFFFGRARLKITGYAYDGTFHGSLHTAISKKPQFFKISANWSDIDLSLLLIDHPELMVSSGTCDGSADLIADFNQYFIYKGPITISIQNTRFDIPAGFQKHLDFLEFNTINARFVFNHSSIQVQQIALSRSDTMIQISGDVDQKIPFSESQINLQARLYMLDESLPFDKNMYIPITLKGALGKPSVYFLGQKL